MCDVYAVIEASRLLETRARDDEIPAPVRRMLIHALQRFDEDIETYFKPLIGRDRCSPQPQNRRADTGASPVTV